MDSERAQSAYERSIGDVLSDLFNDGMQLVQQEIELAKAEVRENLSALTRDGIGLAVGGTIAFVGLQTLVAAAVLGLATVLPAWASALIIGGVLALIGLVLVLGSLRAMRETGLMPKRTVETVREDMQMLKEKFR